MSRNSLVLLLLACVFFAPGLAALYFFKHPQWVSGHTTNKGQLIEPPLPAPSLVESSRKWHLVLWSPNECGETCISAVDKLTRIRLALGRRYYEVDQVLLGVSDHPLDKQLEKTLHSHHMNAVSLSDNEKKALLAYSHDMGIFIANPEGFLVLAYAATVQSDDVYSDLKQLLTTTQTKSK